MVKPRMTLEEFLQRLAQTPRDWRLIPDIGTGKTLLRRIDTMCPITALVGEAADYPGRVAERIGLSLADAHAIMNAADGLGEPALRAQLERACGLEAS